VNYNYEMRRRNETKLKQHLITLLVILSLVPITYMLINAEEVLKKSQIKEIRKMRRDALDEKFGINREQMDADHDEISEMFRLNEKEEIEKYREIGKTAQDYFKDKEMQQQQKEQAAVEEEEGTVVSKADKFKEQLSKS